MAKFTICCLFYGNHSDLAERLLWSLARSDWDGQVEVCIGLNNVGKLTEEVVRDAVDVPITDVFRGEPPWYKYPLMRRMLHGMPDTTLRKNRHPGIDTPYTMWFDDDSFLRSPRLAPMETWLTEIAEKLHDHHLIGAPYYMHLRGQQHKFIEDQPWYNGKPVTYRQRVSFITGGWFTIRTEILEKHDWPPKNFEHNGGDVMLGELCRQHDYKIGRFTDYLRINANCFGRLSSAKRRGFSQDPIGVDYVRPTIVQPTLFDILDGKHAP